MASLDWHVIKIDAPVDVYDVLVHDHDNFVPVDDNHDGNDWWVDAWFFSHS